MRVFNKVAEEFGITFVAFGEIFIGFACQKSFIDWNDDSDLLFLLGEKNSL